LAIAMKQMVKIMTMNLMVLMKRIIITSNNNSSFLANYCKYFQQYLWMSGKINVHSMGHLHFILL
jgi:hypothetical protein